MIKLIRNNDEWLCQGLVSGGDMFGKGGIFGSDDDEDKKNDKGMFGNAFHNPNKKTYHRGSNGQSAGYTITNEDNGKSTHYDQRGKVTGRSDRSYNGSEYHYDQNGNRIGRSDKGMFGGQYHYDQNGKRTGTTSRAGLHVDDAGKRVGYSDGRSGFHPGLDGQHDPNRFELKSLIDSMSDTGIPNESNLRVDASFDEFSSDEEFQARSSNGDEFFLHEGAPARIRLSWMDNSIFEEIYPGDRIYMDERWEYLEIRRAGEIRIQYGTMCMLYGLGDSAGLARLVTNIEGRLAFFQVEIAPENEAGLSGALSFSDSQDRDLLFSIFTGLLCTPRTNPLQIRPPDGEYLIPDRDAVVEMKFGF